MLFEDQRQTIILEIERVRGEIAEGVLVEMYQNPFWDARYGERGRIHTRQDTHYHLNKLVSAVDLNNPASLVTYFHWCQGLLVYRGMCTLHLQQTLDSLGHQLARLLPGDWPSIEPIYRASYQGLVYEHPGCLALVERQADIANATAERMVGLEHDGGPGTLDRRREASYQDNLYHLSYLADAVAYQSDEIFTKYVDWLKHYFPTLNLPIEALVEDLRILSDEIEKALGAEQSAPFVRLLGIFE